MRSASIIKNNRGYTLIELLLVVAILSMILGLSVPVFLSFRSVNELDVATNTLVQYLYQAQANSRSQQHECAWGVTINDQEITLFCGNSYLDRNAGYDTTYFIPKTIDINRNDEVIYTQLYGLPESTGSFELAYINKANAVMVNAKGMVEY